ncbi:MAG: hypothetical protein WCX88_02505 [Patescibacteria group bacterium]
MTNSDRKSLQSLQTQPEWEVLEKLLEEYIAGIDLSGSMKRNNEFETIWQRAHSEGGVEHLRNFFKVADSEARHYQ